MKVLVATSETQGEKEFGYCRTVDGELVWLPDPCDDHHCGCGRAFAGVDSRRATSTAEVVDSPDMRTRTWIAQVRVALAAQGLRPACADHLLTDMQRAIRELPVGAIVERSGRRIRVRSLSSIDVLQ